MCSKLWPSVNVPVIIFAWLVESNLRSLYPVYYRIYTVENVNPIDKAGSYGIQDWIGMIGVEHVNGSYTSVLGLPVPQTTNQIIKIINENL